VRPPARAGVLHGRRHRGCDRERQDHGRGRLIMASQLTVSVIGPERTVYEGNADMVVAPAWDGEIGILRGHAPLVILLGDGELRVQTCSDVQRFHVSGGFMQVADDVVTVLSASASTTS